MGCLLMSFLSINAQTLVGIITDSLSNKPLAYANLSVLNSKYGTSTDSLGNYILEIKNHTNDTVLVSMLGFQTKKIPLHHFLDNTNALDIRMSGLNTNLDDVLLVYKKKKYTSAKNLGIPRKKIKFKSSVPIGYERSVFIANKSRRKGKIKSVSFYVKKADSDIYDMHPIYFRIKFYQKHAYNQGPGNAISYYDSILKPNNKNQKIQVNLDDFLIPFLETGIYVGIETVNPTPAEPTGSMYITTPNLIMTYNSEPLTYSSFRGQPWTHLKRKMKWKAFGKTSYYYTNPLIDVEVQFEK